MEFPSEEIIWGARDIYTDSIVRSDDAETVSFRDMPIYNIAGKSAELSSTKRDSSAHNDFHFDLDFLHTNSVPCRTSSADDLFQNGLLLPQIQYKACYSYGDSISKSGLLLNQNLQAWKANSAVLKPSYWTSEKPNNSQLSHRRFNNSSASQKGVNSRKKSRGTVNLSSFPSPTLSGSCSKNLPPWLRLLTLGIIKTPVMKVEDNLKRSVLSYYKEEQPLVKKAASFQQKSKSVKCHGLGEVGQRSKGLRIFRLFSSLNSCKCSVSSVISCSNDKKCVDMETVEDHVPCNSTSL